MTRIATKFTAALGAAAVCLSPLALATTSISMLSADAVFAAGNGNGNGNGNGGNGNGGNGNGGNGHSNGNGNGHSNGNGNGHANDNGGNRILRNHGNGNGNGNSNGNRGNGRGAIASELKNLNAAHASPNARLHASPNSNVGRIAAYEEAARAAMEAEANLENAEAALVSAEDALQAEIDGYSGRSTAEILDDIEALDPNAPDYAEQYESLRFEMNEAMNHEDAVERLEGEVETAEMNLEDAQYQAEHAAELEGEALLVASRGRTLSDEAMAEFRNLLNLSNEVAPPLPDADGAFD